MVHVFLVLVFILIVYFALHPDFILSDLKPPFVRIEQLLYIVVLFGKN